MARRNQRTVGVRKSKGQLGVSRGGDQKSVPHVANGKTKFVMPDEIRACALTPQMERGV